YGEPDAQEVGIGSHQMPDGHIYMVGNVQSPTTVGYDVLLLKINPAGEVVWERSFDEGESEFAQDFIFKNGKFIIVGERNLTDGFNKNAFVLQVDTAGNKLEFNEYGSPVKTEMFQGVAATEQGFIVCGFITAENGTGNDVFVRHFADLLFESWETTFGSPLNDAGISVAQMPDGNFVLCGDRVQSSGIYNAFVAVLDVRGDVLHDTVIESPYNGGSKNLVTTTDGHVLVVGEMATPTSTSFDIFLTKLTPQAELLWTNYVPSTDASDAGFGLCQVNDGSFFITGYSFNEADANSDIVAISVDSEGGEVARKYFGGPSLDIGYDVVPSQSGGLLLTGKTTQAGQQDAILVHDFLPLATVVEHEKAMTEQLFIHPNPVVPGEALHLPQAWQNAEWKLVDVMGRVIACGVDGQQVVTFGLPCGAYFLSVNKHGKMAVGRFCVL
ncbi:MAG: hypothetical protein MUC59_11440, partial [Saprospiraceae bacterium]|nr:hypothetical protein [Saprospiraceae bacterium]